VALGQAAFALGTDTAGSGRVPAALNNLVGFKPSRGAWPVLGVVPACDSLDCVTAFASCVEDCLLVDAAARSFEPADKWSKKIPRPELRIPTYLNLPRNELEFFGDFSAEYRDAWHSCVDAARKTGMALRFIDIALFREAAAILYNGPWIAERWEALGEFVEAHPDDLFPVTRGILTAGKNDKLTAHALFRAIHTLEKYKQETKELLAEGVLILPTVGGTWTRAQVRENPVETNSKLGLYTNHCNLLDLAALSLPFGEIKKDLPFGVTVFSLGDKEGYLFSVADIIQKTAEKPITLAVHGLHLGGMPLNPALLDLGAQFIGTAKTAPEYAMFALPTSPAKPGLLHTGQAGSSIETELWSIPPAGLGELIAATPAPMSFGKIKLLDGTEAVGFLCEDYAVQGAENISAFGGWKKFCSQRSDML
jgi:allophanate hydrolase